MTEEAREFAEKCEVNRLRAENKVMRDQILEMSRVIEAISTLITMYKREGFAVASSKNPMETYKELMKMFPLER